MGVRPHFASRDPLELPVNDLTKTEPLALRPQQAAKALNISARHLWQLTKDGKIRSVRAGRSVLYPIAELEAWLGGNSSKGVG